MSKSDTFKNDLLLLISNGTTIAGLAQNITGGAFGNLYLSLRTADPGEAGTEATNETTYDGYARQPVARTSAGFAVAGNQASLAANVDVRMITSGAGLITHFAIGVAVSGVTKVLYSGAVTDPIPGNPTLLIIAAGVVPCLTTGTQVIED